MYHRYHTAPVVLPSGQPDDSFHLYYKTEHVVIIYGNGRRLHADEHNHAGRLMKTLDWIGKEGIPIRGMIREQKTLDRSSLRALNLYLQHCNGLTAFRRRLEHGPKNQFHGFHSPGWFKLQELLNLRWVFWR